jgi:excisionase family DNA binding protein
MVRFDLATGTITFEDAAMTARILENEQRARLAAEAEQLALSAIYRLHGKADPSRLYGGLLTLRLACSERTAYQLLRDGHIHFTCVGAKNYRITEAAVRRYLGDAA